MNRLSLPFIPLQSAIFQRLSSDNVLLGLLATDAEHAGIYDYVTEDTPFPYIVIGEPKMDDEPIKANDAFIVSVVLHIWHNQQTTGEFGNAVPYTIMNRLYECFRFNRLEIEGFENVRFQFGDVRVFDDIDNARKHGVFTLKFTLKRGV